MPRGCVRTPARSVGTQRGLGEQRPAPGKQILRDHVTRIKELQAKTGAHECFHVMVVPFTWKFCKFCLQLLKQGGGLVDFGEIFLPRNLPTVQHLRSLNGN